MTTHLNQNLHENVGVLQFIKTKTKNDFINSTKKKDILQFPGNLVFRGNAEAEVKYASKLNLKIQGQSPVNERSLRFKKMDECPHAALLEYIIFKSYYFSNVFCFNHK